MRKFIVRSVLFLIAVPSFANEVPDHWLDNAKSKVYFAPLGRFAVSYEKIDMDDRHFGQLRIRYLQDRASYDANVAAIKNKFPAYSAERIMVDEQPDGVWKVKLPELGLERSVKPYLTQMGPSYDATFYVPKGQHEQALALVQSKQIRIETEGLFVLNAPGTEVVELIKIPSESCEDLKRYGNKAVDLISHASESITRSLARQKILYGTTKANLLKNFLKACIQFADDTRIESFADLVDSKVQVSELSGGWITGETRSQKRVRSEVKQRPISIEYRIRGTL